MFVDEMGTNVSLSPLYAWSRKGERAFGSAPQNWGKNVTLLASITREGLGPCLAVEGPTTREVFEAYLERVLAPSLRPGRIVMLDNLSAHKGGKVREIVEDAGCEVVYLPPYSPDLNPIEQAFSKVKGWYARPKPAPGRRSSRRWAGHRTRSPTGTPVGASGTAVTAWWTNRYDSRSRGSWR